MGRNENLFEKLIANLRRPCYDGRGEGISYGELARLTAIPKSAIQRYATGTTDKIPLERLRALAAALCLPLSALTGWEENGRSDEREELPEITMIARAGKKMSPERRQDMLQLLKIAFPEEFRDDDGA